MVGLVESAGMVESHGFSLSHQKPELGFSVLHQKVQLDIDLTRRRLRGITEITTSPLFAELKTVRLNCRQCSINRISVNGKTCTSMAYTDPYKRNKLCWQASVHQYHMLQERMEGQFKVPPPEPELVVNLPKSTKIQELDPFVTIDSSGKMGGDTIVLDITQNAKPTVDPITRFTSIIVSVDFTIENIRDGMQFVGCSPGDLQYPHAYTQNSMPGSASCLFPCLDAIDSRPTWEVSIKCPRTIGDAFRKSNATNAAVINGITGQALIEEALGFSSFSDEEQALDLVVICSGDMTDEIVDPHDPTKKTTSFVCTTAVAPQHIGFAIGPFELVDLAVFRESDEDDKLGQNAISVHGYCLPGRMEEVKNTCLPMAKAIDFITLTYGSYPFSGYKLCFVEGMVTDCADTASLSLCSSRLLFPKDIIETLDVTTRKLVYALACQWMGVNIVPKEPADTWAVVGMAYFIADMFMRKLSGNNEYRFKQKMAADEVCRMDVSRPSLYDTGKLLWLEPSQAEFLAVKAPLVLFILDRRLTKASGSIGLSRIISRVFLNAKVGDLSNGALNSAYFQKTCEKLGHAKLDVFFAQWVYGAGCPRFRVTQRFNKKRLVVEMLIQQIQGDQTALEDLEISNFMRDVKEDHQGVFAGPVQPVFMGPMTIRIHEADGTPYEHIVEIKEAMTKFDIPYNTKYKRLKRSRRQIERTTGPAVEFAADNQDDVLLYCLGDVLQTEEEVQEWKLSEWTKEDEDKMSQESYEWIRMDADFEWICKMQLNQPGYMYLSQLQQDRDVVAQLESIQYMAAQREHRLVATILTRTLMDRRYFHGIRTTAAAALCKHAKDEINWLGFFHLEKAFHQFFCLPDSKMTRSNDFSDRASYYVQCAIPQSIAKIRDNNGRTPLFVRKFLYEKLRYNDNSNNEFSDCYYVAKLMNALAEALSHGMPNTDALELETDNGDDQYFYSFCLEEIDRYRRIDEWIPSYHNILSMTALDCKRQLMHRGGIIRTAAQFLQYTQDECRDELRILAFSCLMDLGYYKSYHIMKWFLYVLGTDPSPFVRRHLIEMLGRTLGAIAIGDASTKPSDPAPAEEGLIVLEDHSTTLARQADLARKQTVTGALKALKSELSINQVFKTSLWQAIESPALTLHQLSELLEICSLLYDTVNSMVVVLNYPRYWRIRNLGRSTVLGSSKPSLILSFEKTDKVRTKPAPKYLPRNAAQPVPGLNRSESSSSATNAPIRISMKPPKKPGTLGPLSSPALASPAPMTPVEGTKPKLILKLNPKGAGKAGGPATPR